MYNFSCRKYQHNIDTALVMLRNRGLTQKWQEVAEVADRNGVFNTAGLCPMPYQDWQYLMKVVNWARENGSGDGCM
jgi:hypothetical protein